MSASTTRPRVAIIGLYHESNTFIPDPTTFESFKRGTFLLGEEIREKYSNAHHEISGFFEVLAANDIEAVPITFFHAVPWGKVSDEALDTVWGMIEEGLNKAGKLDGVLAAPHGAGVNESRPDMDGWWLTKLREKVGPDLPIIGTMDPHVNLSPKMVKACNALISYRENPHLDQRARGREAATLMVRTLRGEIRPVMGFAMPPVAINIERQLTRAEPILSLTRQVDAVRETPGVLSASTILGFPYADVEEMGTSFVVVTDNDPALAQEKADALAAWLVENRELYRGVMISPEEAFKMVENAPKPVGLLDMGDNLGGGAPGDSMLLPSLFEKSGKYRVLLPVPDRESYEAAAKAGVGARIRLKIGGKLPMSPVPPLETEVTVVSFHDGIYKETQPRHGGKTGGKLGPTVIVKTDGGLTVAITSNRASMSTSPAAYRSCCIEPKDFDVIILRGVHAPVGGFFDICPTLIRVNTPGVTSADMESFTYHNRRRPLFPFEEI